MAKMPITSYNTICIGEKLNKKFVNPSGNGIDASTYEKITKSN